MGKLLASSMTLGQRRLNTLKIALETYTDMLQEPKCLRYLLLYQYASWHVKWIFYFIYLFVTGVMLAVLKLVYNIYALGMLQNVCNVEFYIMIYVIEPPNFIQVLEFKVEANFGRCESKCSFNYFSLQANFHK